MNIRAFWLKTSCLVLGHTFKPLPKKTVLCPVHTLFVYLVKTKRVITDNVPFSLWISPKWESSLIFLPSGLKGQLNPLTSGRPDNYKRKRLTPLAQMGLLMCIGLKVGGSREPRAVSDSLSLEKTRPAHELRALAASMALLRWKSYTEVIKAVGWSWASTFGRFYLRHLGVT